MKKSFILALPLVLTTITANAKDLVNFTAAPSNYLSVQLSTIGTCNTSFLSEVETQEDNIVVKVNSVEMGRAACPQQAVTKNIQIPYNFHNSRMNDKKVIIKTENETIKLISIDLL